MTIKQWGYRGFLRVCALLCGAAVIVTTPVSAKASSYEMNSIKSGANFIAYHTSKKTLDSWDALAVKRSPQGMKKATRQAMVKSIQSQFKDLQGHYAATDYERNVIGAVSLGKNPRKFMGENLINGVIKTAPAKTAGINSKIFGIIALSTKNYGPKSKKVISQLLSQVIKAQNSDGGWSLMGTKSDLDITGMALMALGMHRTTTGAQAAINRAVSMMSKQAFRKSTGAFVLASAYTNKENSNSQAMVIAGLSACGINVEKQFKGSHGVTPIKRLIKFQKKSGQFRWLLNSNKGALNMSTQQAVYAMEQYHNTQTHKGSIFKF